MSTHLATRMVGLIAVFLAAGCTRTPSDDSIIARFNAHRGRAQVTLWSVGMLWAGQDKSIVYIPGATPQPIVKATDHYQWSQKDHVDGSVTLYRHIEGPWYLQYIAN